MATLHGLAPRFSFSCPLHKVHFRLTGAVTHKHRVHAPGPESTKTSVAQTTCGWNRRSAVMDSGIRKRGTSTSTDAAQSSTGENETFPVLMLCYKQAIFPILRAFQNECCAQSSTPTSETSDFQHCCTTKSSTSIKTRHFQHE